MGIVSLRTLPFIDKGRRECVREKRDRERGRVREKGSDKEAQETERSNERYTERKEIEEHDMITGIS